MKLSAFGIVCGDGVRAHDRANLLDHLENAPDVPVLLDRLTRGVGAHVVGAVAVRHPSAWRHRVDVVLVEVLGEEHVGADEIVDVDVLAEHVGVAEVDHRCFAAEHPQGGAGDEAGEVQVAGPEDVAAAHDDDRQLVLESVRLGDQVGAGLRGAVDVHPAQGVSLAVGQRLGIVLVGVVAVGLVGRGDEHARDVVDPGRLEQIQGRGDVVLERAHRRVGGVTDDRRRGQVEDRVDLMAVADPLHLQEVRHVADLDVRAQLAGQELGGRQGPLMPDGHHDHGTALHQRGREVGGGEAVSAGDQHTPAVPEVVHHTAFSLSRRTRTATSCACRGGQRPVKLSVSGAPSCRGPRSSCRACGLLGLPVS